MDKSQNEVTDKIRSAIKKKLIEINVFVDDELPDYIMILIANKRSKQHMEKDLSLFLGSHTQDFTDWLWDLVNAFKSGAKSKSIKGNVNFELEPSRKVDSKENRTDEDDVLNYDPAEEGETLCLEEMNEPSSYEHKETKIAPTVQNTNEICSNDPQVSQTVVKTEPPSTPIKEPVELVKTSQVLIPVKQEISGSMQVRPTSLSLSGKATQKAAKVYPMQRSKHVSSNTQEKKNDAKSPSKPELAGSVSSVVSVSQRKYGGSTPLQVNKLLLRAINDATKSVLNGKDINDFYKPTPIQVLESSKVKELDTVHEENPNAEVNSNVHIVSENIDASINVDVINQKQNEQSDRTISFPQVNCDIEMLEDSDSLIPDISESILPAEEEIPITPHFIVTLDGIEFPSLKRKHSVDDAMEIDEEDEDFDQLSDHVSGKKQKLIERCKYWPACKNSDNCDYHHPTVSCKRFPNCKFGDKCLYIHPNCKFDSLCSRKDCPFTHCSKRQFKNIPTSVIRPIKIPSSKVVCKYYPKCTVKSCQYIHPKLCRFGTQCRAPKCAYGHFQIPHRNLLKWKASSALIVE